MKQTIERTIREIESEGVYLKVWSEFFELENKPRAHYLHPWWSVRNRIVQAPAEYHGARYEMFRKERERQDKKFHHNNNAQRLKCGCVVGTDTESDHIIHWCPTHWAERKNRYASAR